MCEGVISKILLFVLIFVILIASIILIVFGSIGLADPRLMFSLMAFNDGIEYLNDLINTAQLIQGVSIFMVTLGGLLFLQSIIGFCGVTKTSKTQMMIFWISLILAVATELGLICYAAVYPQNNSYKVQYQLRNSLYGYQTETIDPYTGEITFSASTSSFAWQNLQSKAHCCGAGDDFYNGYKDYADMNLDYQFRYVVDNKTYESDIPPSCCTTKSNGQDDLTNVDQIYSVPFCFGVYGYENNNYYYYKDSCWMTVEEMIYKYNYISIFTCASLIIAQIFAFTLTIRIWNAVRKMQEL